MRCNGCGVRIIVRLKCSDHSDPYQKNNLIVTVPRRSQKQKVTNRNNEEKMKIYARDTKCTKFEIGSHGMIIIKVENG